MERGQARLLELIRERVATALERGLPIAGFHSPVD